MFKRRHLPTGDLFDDMAPDVLTWLQGWYATQCDGDWEHGYGISIDTLDNPGWQVRVDLARTGMLTKALEPTAEHRSEHDWYEVRLRDGAFEGVCGPLNLGEVLHLFRLWAQGPPALAT